MNPQKLILYFYVLGICFPVALTYVMIVNLIIGEPIRQMSVFILAFSYVIMIYLNPVFHELWQK